MAYKRPKYYLSKTEWLVIAALVAWVVYELFIR